MGLTRNELAKELGRNGEVIAAKYYQANGFEVLAKNFHTRYGELDLVVHREGEIHFVEVKTRKKIDADFPLLTPLKLVRMRRAIGVFLVKHNCSISYRSLRMELVFVTQDRVTNVLSLSTF